MNSAYIPRYSNRTIERDKIVPTEKIFQVVEDYFGITTEIMMTKTRKTIIAYPRQVCIWLLAKHSCHSVPGIGVLFGFKDSSSAVNAVKSIDNYLATDDNVKEQIDFLEQKLKQ